jgi:hypothetical protein
LSNATPTTHNNQIWLTILPFFDENVSRKLQFSSD